MELLFHVQEECHRIEVYNEYLKKIQPIIVCNSTMNGWTQFAGNVRNALWISVSNAASYSN